MSSQRFLAYIGMGSVLWSVGFFYLASFAFNKARVEDPEIIEKVRENLIVQLEDKGVSVSGIEFNSSVFGSSHDSWTFKGPIRSLDFKGISSDLELVVSPSREIRVFAEGRLNKSKNLKLLQVKYSSGVLEINDLRDESTRDVRIRVELPQEEIFRINLENVSGDFKLKNIMAKKLIIKTVSGDISGENLSMQICNFETISGDLDLDQSFDKTKIAKLQSVSGDVEIKLKDPIGDLGFNIKSVSGAIRNDYPSSAVVKNKVEIITTSGDISIR